MAGLPRMEWVHAPSTNVNRHIAERVLSCAVRGRGFGFQYVSLAGGCSDLWGASLHVLLVGVEMSSFATL